MALVGWFVIQSLSLFAWLFVFRKLEFRQTHRFTSGRTCYTLKLLLNDGETHVTESQIANKQLECRFGHNTINSKHYRIQIVNI